MSTIASERPEDPLWVTRRSGMVQLRLPRRRQYQESYTLAEYREDEYEISQLKTWDVAPRGKGRPKEKPYKKSANSKIGYSRPSSPRRAVTIEELCLSRNLRVIENNLSVTIASQEPAE